MLALIVAGYAANRLGHFAVERAMGSLLVLGLGALVWFGILKLKRMQADFDRRCPPKKED
jgi:hypothetical protein